MTKGCHRTAVAIDRKAIHRRAFQQKRHNRGFVKNARHQLAVFQVIACQRRFIVGKAPVDLLHAMPRIVDGFSFTQQLLRHRLQAE